MGVRGRELVCELACELAGRECVTEGGCGEGNGGVRLCTLG